MCKNVMKLLFCLGINSGVIKFDCDMELLTDLNNLVTTFLFNSRVLFAMS